MSEKNGLLSPVFSLNSYIQLVEMADECKLIDFYSALRGLGYKVNGNKFDRTSTTIRQFLELECATKSESNLIFLSLFSKLIETDWGYGISITKDLVFKVAVLKGGLPFGFEFICKENGPNESWEIFNSNDLNKIYECSESHKKFVVVRLKSK